MKNLMEVIDVYKAIWKDMNWFGKCTFFLLFLLVFPFFFIITLGFKKD